jgi:hypothetical protein
MRQESFIVVNHAARIMLCMIQYLVEKKYFIALKNAILLYVDYFSLTLRGNLVFFTKNDEFKHFRNKCLRQKLWEDTLHVVRQLDKIGPASAASLVAAGITSFEKLEQTDPRTIESVQIAKNRIRCSR